VAELIAGMFNASRYKRSQGKVARQITFAAMAVAICVGAWLLSEIGGTPLWQYVIPLAIAVVGIWASFRIINIPRFADFLISVEAEMNKVSWPSRGELWRASMVVIVTIFFLAGTLFGYDLALKWLMEKLFRLLDTFIGLWN
jgi:preprotein translocase subunit SecE